MPSTQTPPIAGAAIDPPSLRPPIDDAVIERVAPSDLRARLEALKADGYAMLLDLGAVDYLGRAPRFDVVYHLLRLAPKPATVAEVGTPARVRILCGSRKTGRCPRSATFGSRRTGPSAKSSTCSEFASTGIPISGGYKCRTIGSVIRCAKIIRCAGQHSSARRAPHLPTRPTS